MTVITASANVLEQSHQTMSVLENINSIAVQINELANRENDTDANERIKSLLGSINIIVSNIAPQQILLQQAIDTLAGLIG